jgi:hypothetical protein
MMQKLAFSILDGRYALTRLPAGSPEPGWATGQFTAVIRSREGLTVVSREGAVPQGAETKSGFRCLEVGGAHALDAVGMVAAASAPLASAGISLFLFSTWETDYILIEESQLDRAKAALRLAGHSIP